MKSNLLSRDHILLVLICVLSALALLYGWKTFWFLTDDAYIAFRYVSNSQLGYGYVWNFPPFPHVEGYTSFLWVAILDIVWRVTGVEPPASANWISLGFAFGSLALTILMFLRMPLRPALKPFRLLLLAILLFAILANRTFLAWTSSGLETAMFNFFILLWVFACLCLPVGTPVWMFAAVGSSVLIALARPDGYLFMAMTLVPGALYLIQLWQRHALKFGSLLVFSPVLVVAGHILWRKWFYGEWEPNTSLAKNVAPWLDSGARYILSFVLEYALWFWLALLVLYLAQILRTRRPVNLKSLAAYLTLSRQRVALVVILALVGQVFYYTVFIGGDHFEYRIYSDLIPLLFLSSVWLLNELQWLPRVVLVVWTVFVLCTLPIPWLHWIASQKLTTRAETFRMQVPVAPFLPGIFRPYGELFDELQFWMIDRSVGMRHQEHKIFAEYQLATLPSRREGMSLSATDHPILVAAQVGVISWVMPTTNIIDSLGLNDPVIARNPVNPTTTRQMAHDRFPPPGYIECFQPNVQVLNSKTILFAAGENDPVARIAACASKNWDIADTASVPSQPLALGINEPLVRFLKSSWLSGPLYLSLVPHQDESAAGQVVPAFQKYNGDGCGLILPTSTDADSAGRYFLLSFLIPGNSPVPPDLVRFNQTHLLNAIAPPPPTGYAVGYLLPMNSAAQVIPSTVQPFDFGNGINLIGYDLPTRTWHKGDHLTLTLYYTVARKPAPANFYVILRPVSKSSKQTSLVNVIQNPCNDFSFENELPSGTRVILKTGIALPNQLTAQSYTLSTGFAQRRNSPALDSLGQVSVTGP